LSQVIGIASGSILEKFNKSKDSSKVLVGDIVARINKSTKFEEMLEEMEKPNVIKNVINT
jgi:hypothetical protein